MKTFKKINKALNNGFILVLLVPFYIIFFGVSKLLFIFLRKKITNSQSYWTTHIEKDSKIDYASAY